MRASIVTRLDKLNRRVPPAWVDLARLMLPAGEELNQAEVTALLAHIHGTATAEQEALWDEWKERNRPRFWAVWDERFPGWQDAPFWGEGAATEADEHANEDNW